jgi:hypothetical protein
MDDIVTGKLPILFGSLKGYEIWDRARATVQILLEAYAPTGQVGIFIVNIAVYLHAFAFFDISTKKEKTFFCFYFNHYLTSSAVNNWVLTNKPSKRF